MIVCLCYDDSSFDFSHVVNSIKVHTKQQVTINRFSVNNEMMGIEDFKKPVIQSKAQYWRWFIPELYNYDKVIYFDSDVVVVGDIKDLWDIDITDYHVLATKDKFANTLKNMIPYQTTGDIPDKYYNLPAYNSGQLVINCKRWREDGITKKLVNFANEYKTSDMLAMNCICKIEELDYNWCLPINHLDENLKSTTPNLKDYDYKPKLYHWHGRKPWNEIYIHWSKKIFDKYVNI